MIPAQKACKLFKHHVEVYTEDVLGGPGAKA